MTNQITKQADEEKKYHCKYYLYCSNHGTDECNHCKEYYKYKLFKGDEIPTLKTVVLGYVERFTKIALVIGLVVFVIKIALILK